MTVTAANGKEKAGGSFASLRGHGSYRQQALDPTKNGSSLFHRTQNASELLAFLAVDDVSKRPAQFAKLRSEGTSLKRLIHLGADRYALMQAGFAADELSAAGLQVIR